MNIIILSFLIGIGLSALCVLGDAFIKHSSLQSGFSGWHIFTLGALIYGLSAIGWFFVMKNIKLSTIGVLESVSSILLLTLVGVFYFKEEINHMEIFGIVLALSSLVILARFA